MSKRSHVVTWIIGLSVGHLWCGSVSVAQDSGSNQVVLTEEAKKKADLPELQARELIVNVDKERAKLTEAVPIRPGGAGLELLVVIDDGVDSTVANQFSDLSRFIQALPESVYVGVGYMRNGGISVVQQPTNDHAKAAKSFRIPLGDPGISASPYAAIADFTKNWQGSPQRAREMIVITDGVDLLFGGGPSNTYLDSAIDQAQRGAVVIYSIYTPGAFHRRQGFFQVNWAQNNLGRLSDETGGELYGYGLGPPVSFAPYLNDLSDHLKHQYLLSLAPPEGKTGFKGIRVQSEGRNSDLVTQKRIYIPTEGK